MSTTTQAEATYYSPRQYADKIGVRVEAVLGWIRDGELIAVDISRAGSTRPRWRVTSAAIEAFERMRSTQGPKQRTSRRRRKPADDVIDFFPE